MKKCKLALLILMLVLTALPAGAQESEASLQLSIHRDFGFGMGSRIQGRFTLQVTGPEGLARVEFLIDEQVVGVDSEPPFRFSFSTSNYQLGDHRISAVGFTTTGEELSSAVRTLMFISAEEGWRAAMGIAVPMVVGVIVLILAASLGTMLIGRSRGAPRVGEYGMAGGAVCPRCELPYRRHFISPNMLVGKLERCPHCGKWAVVRRAKAVELAAAEARWVADATRGTLELESEEDHLQRLIEESRYER